MNERPLQFKICCWGAAAAVVMFFFSFLFSFFDYKETLLLNVYQILYCIVFIMCTTTTTKTIINILNNVWMYVCTYVRKYITLNTFDYLNKFC